ncbi:MAG: histidine kinase N-terminal 7TM domain-containing protein [Haloferacaceae archaeon]
MITDGGPAFAAYVLAYSLAVVGCVVGLRRAVRVEDADTRRGLVGLLAGSGGWALFELVFLVASDPGVKYVAYVQSLIVGLSTVGAWLYFCSAYTGRSLHRNATYRWTAVAVYLAITGIKITNPFHGYYFTTAFVTTPFPHVTVQHEPAHWIVTGLSYALVAIGLFMLYETFIDASYDTRPLGALVAVTGLPVVLDIVGYTTPLLLDINYEPLGVVVFALGVLYVFDERFLAVQLDGDADRPMIHLDDDDRIREYNRRATELFPDLADAAGRPLSEALPDVAAALETDEPIIEADGGDEPRYYLASDTAFTLGQTDITRLIAFADVTAIERRRRELRRQNDRLGSFAEAIRHELRNKLNVVDGRVEIAGRALDDGDVDRARRSLRIASDTNDLMAAVVDDLANLAQYSRSVDRTRPLAVDDVARDAFEDVAPTDVSLAIETADVVRAERVRLRILFENAFGFADRVDATAVTLWSEPDRLVIAVDGVPLDGTDPDRFLAYGTAVPTAEAGRMLPNVKVMAEAHGWDVRLDADSDDGLRVEIVGATVDDGPRAGGESPDALPTGPEHR